MFASFNYSQFLIGSQVTKTCLIYIAVVPRDNYIYLNNLIISEVFTFYYRFSLLFYLET